MLRKFMILGILVGFTAPAIAAPPGTVERRKNNAELRTDRKEMKNDKGDLARMQVLYAAYKKARKSNNTKAIAKLDQRFMKELRVEKAESRKEIRGDKREVKRSKRELARDNKNLRRATLKGQPVKANRAIRNRADDRRDLRDDRRDLRKEVKTQNSRSSMLARYKALVGKTDMASLRQKEDIIRNTMRMAQQEIRANRVERNEDRREKKEDRRQRSTR